MKAKITHQTHGRRHFQEKLQHIFYICGYKSNSVVWYDAIVYTKVVSTVIVECNELQDNICFSFSLAHGSHLLGYEALVSTTRIGFV